MQCCGMQDYKDYCPDDLPNSCCPKNTAKCNQNSAQGGCVWKISSYFALLYETLIFVMASKEIVQVCFMNYLLLNKKS